MAVGIAHHALGRTAKLGSALIAAAAILAAGGCSTGHPPPIAAGEFVEAQTFPYYPIYWVGRSFEGHPLAAVDGLTGYISTVGDSVYYGDCVQSKGVFGGGSCLLPLQVTTVIYRLHSNATLGPQTNMLVRGVPVTVYDEGRSIEIYSGRVAIDVFSDRFSHALQAVKELVALNAPGSASADLPAPVYCPGLSGPIDGPLAQAMSSLPARACQRAAAQEAITVSVTGEHRYPEIPAGATGSPISRRRLRKASDPISAGSHREIAR